MRNKEGDLVVQMTLEHLIMRMTGWCWSNIEDNTDAEEDEEDNVEDIDGSDVDEGIVVMG